MKTITLNKCLTKLDMIMFGNVEDPDIIVEILNDIRKYVINSKDRKNVMTILQFINYMIQSILSSPITNQFLNHCSALRSLILKLEAGNVLIIDEDEDDEDDDSWPKSSSVSAGTSSGGSEAYGAT